MTKLERLMQDLPQGTDAAVIMSRPNRRYYLGYDSHDAGLLFVTREAAYFIIDFRYIETARARISDAVVLLQGDVYLQVKKLCDRHAVKTAAMETGYVTFREAAHIRRMLFSADLLETDELDDLILRQRAVKDADEIATMKEAQRLTDKTFDYILPRITQGKTEREIALDMEFFMRGQGAEAVSFDFIVVAGKNSSLPHGVPADNVLERGDFVTMDFGAVVDGYHADMTRTVAIGEANDEQRAVYETVLRAQNAVLDRVKAGVNCAAMDKIARDIIDKAGYEGHFGHGLGHSVGIEIHESPRFSPHCNEKAPVGTIMTIEPGIYLEGRFGVRIEDCGVITQNGFDNFTKSPKDLMIL
ncbi:MAG: M24 family metallopeptidase [Acetanaerobacterium sp.]